MQRKSKRPAGPRPPELKRERVQDYLADRDVPCPKCGYNLRNLTSGECPECGSWFSLWDLIRTQSRPRLLRLWPAVLVALAACAVVPVVLLHQPPGDPTTVPVGWACPAVGLAVVIFVLAGAFHHVRRGKLPPAARRREPRGRSKS